MATVEYVALFVLVSLALAVGGAAVDARALPGAVAGQLRHAYCLVANGDCAGGGRARPCVVSSRGRTRETRLELAIVRLRDGRGVLREQLSDGTVRVTLLAANGASAATRVGARFGRVAVSADAAAGLDVGNERTFVVADDAAAAKLIERLDGSMPGAGVTGAFDLTPDGEEVTRTVTIATRAEAAAEMAKIGPELGVAAGLVGGVRIGRDGRRSLLLRLPRAVAGELAGALDVGAEGMIEAELGLDPRRRPETLVLRAGAESGGRRIEAEARLDLGDRAARERAGRLLGGDAGSARALIDGARVDVRRYRTTRAERDRGGSLFGVGGSKVVVERTAQLESASGRDPGGRWGPNLICLHAR